MDAIAPNIIPLASNLEDIDPPLVSMMLWDTCPMLGDVDIPIGIILTNLNDSGRHNRHLALLFFRIKSFKSIQHGFKACKFEHGIIVDESISNE